MAPKRVLPSHGVRSATKKSRKTLTLEKKMEVLDMYKKGLRTSVIVKTMGLNESTLRCIRNNEMKIRASVKAGSTLRSSHSRPPIMGKMEKLLSTWIDHRNRCNVPVSMKLVQAKAKCIYDDLKKDDKKPFTASSGWFANFRKRYGYHNINETREVAASAKKPGSEYSAILKTIIEEGDYSAKQVFNIDETGLYWKKLPETYIPVEETTVAGFKSFKDRLTVMFGCNAEGDCKLKPVLIYHSENPRALKGYDKAFLPVHWYANKNGLMTSSVFSDYFKNKLHSELEVYCKQERIPFKILLLLDNAASHPHTLCDLSENIKLVFLPPSATSLHQPLHQGVIQTFHLYYLRSTLADLVTVINEKGISVRDYWRNFNIKNALNFLKMAWDEVPSDCINGVWKYLCPQFVYNIKGFSIEGNITTAKEKTVVLAKKLGFCDVEEDEIEELLQSHHVELSNEDLLELERIRVKEEEAEASQTQQHVLSLKVLSDAMGKLREALDMIEENDPNVQRSSSVSRRVLADFRCYQEMLLEKQQKSVQMTFLKRKGEEEEQSEDEPRREGQSEEESLEGEEFESG